ncbi:GNAT family N-acetyltransferase [Shewanella maritima]|uniref:GNAT family N-acetyltransferase n=1 Tax=Shewanella maritima TaxID=2520507 RepID=UPI003736111A
MNQQVKHACLSGENVILEPLKLDHVPALIIAAGDGDLWQLWFTHIPDGKGMKAYVEQALTDADSGDCIPFVVRHRLSGKIIGCTRICHYDQIHRRLEIGYTWYGKSFQRTAVNTETKWLLLNFAFNELQCIAVEFRTHWHNQASRQAITRLGAKQDGVLRNHRIQADGTLRDTVVFSIIDKEWPQVSSHLKGRLAFHQHHCAN